ncbi:hypothetical protein [Myxococcus stipitatus]|uniref:hypothetical protein n=1 Tax=Myxococcus stipitatus TaxID=83455 RepID=UPI0030D4CBA6
MRMKRSGLAALLLLSLPEMGWAEEPPWEASDAGASRWHVLTRVETTTWMLLSREGGAAEEGFIQVEPTFLLDGGPEFGIDMGAPVRFWMWGGGEGLVRREDWDSLSDWGQLVRGLRWGSVDAPMSIWLGAIEEHSLLSGHLVRRYSNRANPDYHPAGVAFAGTLGPLYTQVFASDVLGARLMGAELSLDVEHILFGQPEDQGRYTLALSAVHDWGQAETRAPSVTLAHLDATAGVLLRPDYEIHVVAGWGGRPGERGAWGVVAGVGADVLTEKLILRLRLEARLQRGGFRQGFFGADYELARFQAAGAEGVPVVDARFPEGSSAFGEVEVGWDAVSYGGLYQHLTLSLGLEAFTWGRFDADGRVAFQLFARSLEVALKGLAVGAGEPGARYLGAAEVRWRFLGGKLYVMGTGGTLLFPTEEGGLLRPRVFASVGLGVDNAR